MSFNYIPGRVGKSLFTHLQFLLIKLFQPFPGQSSPQLSNKAPENDYLIKAFNYLVYVGIFVDVAQFGLTI